MKLPLHLLRLRPPPSTRDHETVQVVTRHERDAGSKPLFRAPALPTLHQLNRELPFTVYSRPRLRERD
jgi:hypothetical protein